MHRMLFKKFFSRRSAFSIIELLIFAAIFTVLMVAFISITVTITAVHTRQTGVAEVNQQSQFLLQQMQNYIERASMIELEPDVVSSTLKLRMAESAEDPTYLYLASSTVYLQQGSSTAQPLTSSRVNVSNLSFTKKMNSPAHDSVSISFIVAFNSQNLKQAFTQTLQSAIARVSAATFDFNIVPSSTASGVYKLGVSGQTWSSINDLIYFSGSNVGIGVSSPNAKLQISGGDVYVDTGNYGVTLRDTIGVCWRVTVSTTGTLRTASSVCP